MTNSQIITTRLTSQQLKGSRFKTPADLVSYFGAMQAQDFAMAKFAVCLRTGINEKVFDKAFQEGKILRTHVLRPTWHLVAAEDIRWMLALTAPYVKKLLASLIKTSGLEIAVLNRSLDIITRLLEGGHHLTRSEIITEISKEGISAPDIHPNLIMMTAELEALVCNGPMKGKQHTYALLDERVAVSPGLTKEEALQKLANKYFTAHGPATIHDFIWWSGLSVTDAKVALELIRPSFESFISSGQTYFFKIPEIAAGKSPRLLLLPAFDEYIIGYKDRTHVIPIKDQPKAFTKNGLFKPTIAVEGKIIGVWKPVLDKNAIIESDLFKPANAVTETAITKAALRYKKFRVRSKKN